MKKIFTLVAMAMIAVGANAQTLVAERDWTGVAEYDLGFFQEGESDATYEMVADGIAITHSADMGEGKEWQPQMSVLQDFNLEIDETYKVVITAKIPADGNLQVNMGDWTTNKQYVVPVTASDDFQEIEVEFPDFPDNATGAHVLFQPGRIPGTTIVKKVQVFNMSGGTESEEEIVDITANFTYTWNADETLEFNEDGSITFNSQTWGGMAAWFAVDDVPVDWSGYSKVVFEYAEPTTVNTQILVGDAKAWGDVGITSLECSFEGVDMSAISQIALQTSEPTTLVVKRVYLVVGGASGIKDVKATQSSNSAIYNLAGQKVNTSYKGIVIKNGKKFIQK